MNVPWMVFYQNCNFGADEKFNMHVMCLGWSFVVLGIQHGRINSTYLTLDPIEILIKVHKDLKERIWNIYQKDTIHT